MKLLNAFSRQSVLYQTFGKGDTMVLVLNAITREGFIYLFIHLSIMYFFRSIHGRIRLPSVAEKSQAKCNSRH